MYSRFHQRGCRRQCRKPEDPPLLPRSRSTTTTRPEHASPCTEAAAAVAPVPFQGRLGECPQKTYRTVSEGKRYCMGGVCGYVRALPPLRFYLPITGAWGAQFGAQKGIERIYFSSRFLCSLGRRKQRSNWQAGCTLPCALVLARLNIPYSYSTY